MPGNSRRSRRQHGGTGGPRRRNGQAAIGSTNAYGRLADLPERGFESEELNPHLMERFRGSYGPNNGHSNPQLIQAPNSSLRKANNDIREYFEDADKPVVGGNWLLKPEIPSPSEIISSPAEPCFGEDIIGIGVQLLPNKIEGAYESNEEYLGIQYNLLRDDAIRPLREAVDQVRNSPYLDESEYTGCSVGIYEPVYITSIVFSPRGLATRVAFSLSRVKKHIRWKQSKRLITGTLVALSPAEDIFQEKCILATVAARPIAALNQNPPEIDLFFARAEDMEIDPMKKWIMVECRSSFFEASRHTLMALQHMMRETFPLSEHLVKVQTIVKPPQYVQENPYIDMSSLVTMEDEVDFRNVNVLTQWPETKSHNLDKSQSQALRRILTNRLAMVQGPPGTGKTYVSIVALKILLSNMRENDPPIVVTCQTNHALDQLLRHIAEFEPNFVRLGGRSKDRDKIKKRTLYEIRQNFSQPRSHGSFKIQAITEIKKLTSKMQMLLAPLEANKPPLDHRVLVQLGLLTEEQAQSLEMDAMYTMGVSTNTPGIQMEQWLGTCLTPCHRPILPDDFGMEFEEEDFEEEQLKELEAEALAEDDDFDTLRGPNILLSDNWTGKRGNLRTDTEIMQALRNAQDLTTIPIPDRATIYSYFQRHSKRLIVKEFRVLAKKYEAAVLQRKVGQWEQDANILREQRLVGMTTTGLSKYRGLIRSLRPRVVLVEEAAETLEAPVTSACLPTLEHLILVGDHQQLRPHCQVHDLEDEPYFFNLSLFERLVLNQIELDTLTKQRRMIPEVRRLLEPIYDNTLKDHPMVKDPNNRPPVEGMGGCNSFFFTHKWSESRDGNMSALNDNEAKMVVGFFDYLVLNGVDPRNITILTFYNGQRKTIIKQIRQHSNLMDQATASVVTVDSYQGEENDIVLLSLVRSNRRHNIGFLSVDNRVCVALSRAKRGFYIFGDAEMLACESATWAEIVNIMYGKKTSSRAEKKHHVGYCFPVQCEKHGRKTWIEEPGDWDRINGGCEEKCRCILPCGHTCALKCHPFDSTQINCTQKCNKRVQDCGHPCTAICCDPCKCGICEIRHNGNRAMLKHNTNLRATKLASHLQTQHSSNLSFPTCSTDCSGHSSSSVHQWSIYANGGSKKDDTAFLRQVKNEETKYSAAVFPELIEVSPQERDYGSLFKNENLMVEAGISPPTRQRSPTVTAGKKEDSRGGENLGLLD